MLKTFLVIIVVALLAGVFRASAFLVYERSLEKADCGSDMPVLPDDLRDKGKRWLRAKVAAAGNQSG